MNEPRGREPDDRRFRRRLALLAIVALAGILALAGRMVWLQALGGAPGVH